MRPILRVAVLLVAALFALGGRCGGSSGGGDGVYALLTPSSIEVPQLSYFDVEVVLSTSQPVQAWEFDLAIDPSVAVPVEVLPHPQFDDDGRFFVEPAVELFDGRVSRVVDLRHGASAATGTFAIATVRFWAHEAGETAITLENGGAAGPDGAALPVEPIGTQVVVTP